MELDGAGDFSELHLQDPEAFGRRILEARGRAAAWLDIAESEAQEISREAWTACEHLAQALIKGLLEAQRCKGGEPALRAGAPPFLQSSWTESSSHFRKLTASPEG